jgi:uncharacterized protein (DUF1810 family)
MPAPNDPYNLQRFVAAQDPVYRKVVEELRRGEKASHWMWFVFPQLRGLGSSPMARQFAIQSLEEAAAYLAHAPLGARLRECTQLVLDIENSNIERIFGFPDHLKFRSCMTLFKRAGRGSALFRDALAKYFDGEEDPLTVSILGEAPE